MGAQLAAAQQREAQARRDVEETHGMFEDIAARVKLDEEEAAQIKKVQDEMVWKDVEASKRAAEVLSKLETERDLRREAEDRSLDLQRRVDQDAVLIDRLRRERDEARRAEE